MPDSDYPVRCEFWGDEITDLSYFDIETQRRFKKADKITLSPSTEIVIEDRAALADKIEHKAKLEDLRKIKAGYLILRSTSPDTPSVVLVPLKGRQQDA